MTIHRAAFAACLVAAFTRALSAAPPEAGTEAAEKRATTTGNAPDTPEAAFKEFMLAMATVDEAGLRRVVLPTEGLEVLLKGKKFSAENAARMRDEYLSRLVITRLKAGDRRTLPDGRVITIGPEQVTDDRVVLLPQGFVLPTEVRRVKGVWLVDARPFIAGRRAAEAAGKAEPSKKESPDK